MGSTIQKKMDIIVSWKSEVSAGMKQTAESLDKLKTKVAEVSKYISNLQEAKNRLSRAVAGLRTRNTNLKISVEVLKAAFRSQEKEINRLRTQMASLATTNEKVARSNKHVATSNRDVATSHNHVSRAMKDLKKHTSSYYIDSNRMRGSTEGWRHSLGMLRNQILLFMFATQAIRGVLLQSIEASTKLENAWIGLRAVTDKTGESFFKAKGFAEDFTKSGLLKIHEVSQGLKNLLSAGFGMDQAIDLLKAGADAAAFNRQGTLELGDAVVGYTQGIKNQNCCACKSLIFNTLTRSYQTIEEAINRGEPFYTVSYNEETEELEYGLVTDFFFNGYQPIVKITLESGKRLEVTNDHRVYTKRGWIEAGNLQINQDEILAVDNHTEIGNFYGQEIELDYKERDNGYFIDCIECGKEVRVKKSKLGRKKFCSPQCSGKYKTKTNVLRSEDNKSCEYCGNSYHRKPRLEEKSRFCSIVCRRQYYAENPSEYTNTRCDYCEKLIYKKPFKIEKDKNNFCSMECKGKFWTENYKGENGCNYIYGKKDLMDCTCDLCGNLFEIRKDRIVRKMGDKHFCSSNCLSLFRQGLALNNKSLKTKRFLMGVESRSKELGVTSKEYLAWRRAVLKRDKRTCQICGSKENLCTHHGISVKERPDLALDVNNGITLCRKCHIEVHKQSRVFKSKFEKVISLEEAGEDRVYDLTVEKNHNFMADQIIVHNCLAFDTKIYDPIRGETRTIEQWHDDNIVPCVLSVNRQTGEMEVIQAEYLHYNGEREVYEIELENGAKIEATANHRFLTQDGFKFLEDLDPENDIIYYADEDEIEKQISDANLSITKNFDIMSNIKVDSNSIVDYINKNQQQEELCQSVRNVEERSSERKVSSVQRNVKNLGIKMKEDQNLFLNTASSVRNNLLKKDQKDFAVQNVLENIDYNRLEIGQEFVQTAQNSFLQKNQEQDFAAINVRQILTRKLRLVQNKQSNAYNAEKNSFAEVEESLSEPNIAQMNVNTYTRMILLESEKSVRTVEKNLRLKRSLKDNYQKSSVQDLAQQYLQEEIEKEQAQKLLQELMLNAKSAEKILNLLENWSREDLELFVQKNVDQKLLVSNSVEKIALVILIELQNYVTAVEKNSKLRNLSFQEEKDSVLKNVKTKHTLKKSQEETIPIINMEIAEEEKKLDLQQHLKNGDYKFIKEIPFDVYDAVEMLKVILTHIIFTDEENTQKRNLSSKMVSPFVKITTEKSINLLNQLLKKNLKIIPTPIKIKRIILKGFEKVFDLSVPEQFNYLATSFVSHNSIMTDNAGITKNLSIMYKEYAQTIGKTEMTLDEAEKRQAIYVGMMKEAAIYQGNLDLLTRTYSGSVQQLSQNIFMAQAALGDTLKMGLKPMIQELTKLAVATKIWIQENKPIIAGTISASFKMFGDTLKSIGKTFKLFFGFSKFLNLTNTSMVVLTATALFLFKAVSNLAGSSGFGRFLTLFGMIYAEIEILNGGLRQLGINLGYLTPILATAAAGFLAFRLSAAKSLAEIVTASSGLGLGVAKGVAEAKIAYRLMKVNAYDAVRTATMVTDSVTGETTKLITITTKGGTAFQKFGLMIKAFFVGLGALNVVLLAIAAVVAILVTLWTKHREAQAKAEELMRAAIAARRESIKSIADEATSLENEYNARLKNAGAIQEETTKLKEYVEVYRKFGIMARSAEALQRSQEFVRAQVGAGLGIPTVQREGKKNVLPLELEKFTQLSNEQAMLKAFEIQEKITAEATKDVVLQGEKNEQLHMQMTAGVNQLNEVIKRREEELLTNKELNKSVSIAKEKLDLITKERRQVEINYQNIDMDKKVNTQSLMIQREKLRVLREQEKITLEEFNRARTSVEIEQAKSKLGLAKENVALGEEELQQLKQKQMMENMLATWMKFILNLMGLQTKEQEKQTEAEAKRLENLKALRLLLEELRGKIAAAGLVGLAKDLIEFRTEIEKLKVRYQEFVKVLGKKDKKAIPLLEELKELIDIWDRIGVKDLFVKRARELSDAIARENKRALDQQAIDLRKALEQGLGGYGAKTGIKLFTEFDPSNLDRFNEKLGETLQKIKEIDEEMDQVREILSEKFRKKEVITSEELRNFEKFIKDSKELKEVYREILNPTQEYRAKAQEDYAKRFEDVQKMKAEREPETPFGLFDKRDELRQEGITRSFQQEAQKRIDLLLEYNLKIDKLVAAKEMTPRAAIANKIAAEKEMWEQLHLLEEQSVLDSAKLNEERVTNWVNTTQAIVSALVNFGMELQNVDRETDRLVNDEKERYRQRLQEIENSKNSEIDIMNERLNAKVENEERIKIIERNAQKNREAIRAKFVANMIRTSAQIIQRTLMEAGIQEIATAMAQASQATAWAGWFAAMGAIMSSNVWTAYAAPAFYAQAGASSALAGASMARGAAKAAIGIGVGVGGEYLAAQIEANNPGGDETYTGTSDLMEERDKRLGGSIRAQEVHLSINPVTYIQSEGDIFIGENITLETFRGLVNEAFVKRAQEAIETGELQLDSIITKEG